MHLHVCRPYIFLEIGCHSFLTLLSSYKIFAAFILAQTIFEESLNPFQCCRNSRYNSKILVILSFSLPLYMLLVLKSIIRQLMTYCISAVEIIVVYFLHLILDKSICHFLISFSDRIYNLLVIM